MMQKEQLIKMIYNAANDNFKDLSQIKEITTNAKFFWFPDKENPIAIIKAFEKSDCNKFWIEIKALQMLGTTRRVCPVLCVSTNLFHIFSPDFDGPYFIAKPFYRNTLDKALQTASDFDKLDIAAQLVDIARLFNGCGYYDYDWRKENDAIDENGKVLRVDLDAAHYIRDTKKWTVNDPTFYMNALSQSLMEWNHNQQKQYEKLLTYEVSNLAVRLSSNIFFNREQDEPGDLVDKIQGTTVDNTPKPVRRKSTGQIVSHAKPTNSVTDHPFRDVLSSVLRKIIGESADKNNINNHEQNFLNPWIKKWKDKYNTKGKTHFKEDESEVLARLFHHLISESNNGFTLDDLHTSLIILSIDFLHARIPTINKSDQEAIQILAPITRFSELRQELGIFAAADTGSTVTRTLVDTPPTVPQIKYETSAGDWLAFKKGKKNSEDFAFSYSQHNFAFAIVADGVSNANGLEAKKSIDSEIRAWIEAFKNVEIDSKDRVKKHLNNILEQIHLTLTDKFEKTDAPHEAHLVMAIVYPVGGNCYINIAQAGKDSHCIVYSPNGDVRTSTIDWMTPPIGSNEYTETSGEIRHFKLDIPEINKPYRVRLYSDGVGVVGKEKIRTIFNINSLINDAGQWEKTIHENIGQDDWSIAGIDIIFDGIRLQKPVAVSNNNEPLGYDSKSIQQNSLFSLVMNTNKRFTLSEPARRFWRKELAEIDKNFNDSELGLIRQVADYIRSESKEETSTDNSVPTSTSKLYNFFFGTRLSLASVLMILIFLGGIFGLALFGYYWYSRENSGSGQTTPTPVHISPTPPAQFSSVTSQNLYQNLKDKKIFVKDGLAGGEDVNNPDLKNFLNDLVEVINRFKSDSVNQSKFHLEVYSTPIGEKGPNQRATDNRASEIRQFLTDKKVPLSSLTVEGKGRWIDNPAQNEAVYASLDRTKAIILIRRIE